MSVLIKKNWFRENWTSGCAYFFKFENSVFRLITVIRIYSNGLHLRFSQMTQIVTNFRFLIIKLGLRKNMVT